MSELSNIGFAGVASFSLRSKKKGSFTSELIIALIERSIRDQCAITRDDIYALYWIYKTDNETKNIEESNEIIPGRGWCKVQFDRQSFIDHWRHQRNAISWFKAGLSSAILDGKLLVLPIIEI